MSKCYCLSEARGDDSIEPKNSLAAMPPCFDVLCMAGIPAGPNKWPYPSSIASLHLAPTICLICASLSVSITWSFVGISTRISVSCVSSAVFTKGAAKKTVRGCLCMKRQFDDLLE